MTDELTPKQELFCREYLADFNGAAAAVRAGYAPKSAHVAASRLLAIDKVSVKLSELIAERMKAADVTAERVLMEFARLAMADVGQAFDENGNLKHIKEIPEDIRRCISGFEVEELWEGRGKDRVQVGVLKKVKLWDKKGSLDSLGKYLKMFVDRVEHGADGSLASLIEKAFQR